MQKDIDLKQRLKSIDHKGYPAYKGLKGSYKFPFYTFTIHHVQGDPFAAPSSVSVTIDGNTARFPKEYYENKHTRIVLCDQLIRYFSRSIQKYSFKAKGSGKSGMITISHCGQEILERSACSISKTKGTVSIYFDIGFPANGRTINARELTKIFFDYIPAAVTSSLLYKNVNQKKLREAIHLREDQFYIREQLEKRDLIAFVANGSILPRESGISSLPLKSAVPFVSPESMTVTMNLPHYGTMSGMGIPKGITLIVGGGYHGKSTLLKALELGVYDHIAHDGREYVITDPSAMKIRSEDGRCIKSTDISPFINHLPNGKDTTSFSTDDASGSTSQAANIIEAMETGTTVFLIDEDTSATNFMIRDELMQRVVHRDQEPITPFIEQVRSLYEQQGISSIIVAGSSGAYFQVADYILQMDQYEPKEITQMAKDIAKDFPSISLMNQPLTPDFDRIFSCSEFLKRERRIKWKTAGKDSFSLCKDTVDLRYVEQLVDSEQTAALALCLLYAQLHLFDGTKTLQEAVSALYKIIEEQGITAIDTKRYCSFGLAVPRKQEIFSCINRYRKL